MLISANREGRRLGTENRKMLSTLTEKYPLEKYPLGVQMQSEGSEVSEKVQKSDGNRIGRFKVEEE